MSTNNWREKLRPASWRGVAFEVAGDEVEFGRNVVVHEFVQRDKPYVEDLGRKVRAFRIDGWICASADNGFNPWPQRDALAAAVEQGGVGTLVHPYYGSLRGHVITMGVKQTSSQLGGLISLSLDFVEVGELEFRARARLKAGFHHVLLAAAALCIAREGLEEARVDLDVLLRRQGDRVDSTFDELYCCFGETRNALC